MGGIEGIARAGKVSTLSLYADDLLLYMSDPTPHGSSRPKYAIDGFTVYICGCVF